MTSTRQRTTPRSSGSSRDRNQPRRPSRGARRGLFAWVALSALIIATPGPDTALVVRNALAAGPRASTMSALGIAVGILAWATAASFGVGVLLERSSTAFTMLKLAGAAYLCYLRLRNVFTESPGDPCSPVRPGKTLCDPRACGQGLVSNLLHPTTGAYFAPLMTQFLVP